jgi:hypothetical protein
MLCEYLVIFLFLNPDIVLWRALNGFVVRDQIKTVMNTEQRKNTIHNNQFYGLLCLAER